MGIFIIFYYLHEFIIILKFEKNMNTYSKWISVPKLLTGSVHMFFIAANRLLWEI